MSLTKQITQFRLTANSNNYDINIQNMDINWEPELFNDIKTSVGGKKLVSRAFAGKRPIIRISCDANIQPSTWDNMVDDILSDFIYSNVDSVLFYPNASETANVAVADYQGGGVASNQITITSHGLKNGQKVRYDNSNVSVTGLTNGNDYYITVVSANAFSFTETINGPIVSITGATGTGDFLYELPYIEVYPPDMSQLMSYQNTVSRFRPFINFEGVERYVTTPGIFGSSA